MEEMERSRHGVVDFWNVMSLISTAFTGRGSSTELAALGKDEFYYYNYCFKIAH